MEMSVHASVEITNVELTFRAITLLNGWYSYWFAQDEIKLHTKYMCGGGGEGRRVRYDNYVVFRTGAGLFMQQYKNSC